MKADVIIEYPVKSLDKIFSYIIPNKFKDTLKVGMKVVVPFNKGVINGIVIGINSNKCDYEMKEILSINDNFIVNEEQLKMAYYLKKTTLCPLISAIEVMMPPSLKIKSDNKDIIDFIEIERKGMIYIVKVTEKVYERKNEEKGYCNIYAKKSGIIKTITVYKGTPLIKPGSYVKKGDLIVSGDILLNENVVSTVCASAKVYAESWYTVNEKIPLKYTKDTVTNKKRNNFIINFKDKDYVILKDRLKNFTSKEKLLFSGFGIKIYKRIDYEILKKEEKYSLKDAEKKALELAKEKVLLSLDEKDEILTEKVLQKSINDSIMNIDIFITTKENIATLS